MMTQPDGEEFAEAAEEFELEVAESELVRFAVDKYTAKGYEGINDCLFALLCDVTSLYANRTRTPGGSPPFRPRLDPRRHCQQHRSRTRFRR
jgi:hypothetical protein